MAEYIIGDADNCVLISESVSFEQAAPLMCAGATTWAGLKATGVTGPAPVGIVGIGGLGTLAVQFSKALGHSVVALHIRSHVTTIGIADAQNVAEMYMTPDLEGRHIVNVAP